MSKRYSPCQLKSQLGTRSSRCCLPLGSVAVGALVYLSHLVLFDRSGLAEVRQVLTDFGVPVRHLDRWPFNRSVASTPR